MPISFIKTEKQERLYKLVSELADKFNERAAKYDEAGEFPLLNFEELRTSGYTSLSIPKEHGGEEGLSLYDLVLLQERLAQGDGSTALSIGWHLGATMDLFDKKRWNDEKRLWYAKQVLQGALFNRAATEPQTGSPTRGGKPQTTAKKEGNKWILSGRKTFTTMAPVLDYIGVIASIDGTDQVGEFLVERTKPGVTIEETWDTISMRGTGSHDLVLSNVVLEEDDLVEMSTPELKVQPNGWLLHIPACYLGIAIAARNYAVTFANEYSPNSIIGPIKTIPNVARTVGEMEAELLQARHVLYSIADKWDRLDDRSQLGPELGLAKYIATNSAISVVDKAMRIVGARSLQKSNPLQRYYRDVRAGLHNPPMDDMTIAKLANLAFKEME
ncbi:acyl-CoA dehydrogenase family protein [Bacillus timonensis]|uniref:acyl-CoA dehydrogenase family protein n=1 Tax=Bacillus timonensis TaxID=1033734 RepID=UPI00028840E7|nr:acyl-CoA dehydrogenase family protein [Bacillus timonensis]